jgi:surface polysaccharide O-acyltransferase-like enzyme
MRTYLGNAALSVVVKTDQMGRYAIPSNSTVITTEKSIDFANNFLFMVIGITLLLLLVSFQINSFSSDHIMYLFCYIACMIATAFQVPGDQDIISTDSGIFRVFHHIGYAFTKN